MITNIKIYIRFKILNWLGLTNLILNNFQSNYFNNSINVRNVFIDKNCTIVNCKFGFNNKIGKDSNFYNVEYGDFSYNSMRVTIMNCIIGKFCSIAQDVSIGLGKHPVDKFISTHPAFYSTHKQCGYTFADQQYYGEMGIVKIGNDVWIGANAIILDDVTIGDGAIIAANSLVNYDVPAYAIVAGSPAKIIKYRFSEELISFLMDFKWWDKDIEWLQSNFKLFHNQDEFIQNIVK